MIKVVIGGIAVGLANIIPGVSGGTMLVVLGLFSSVMSSISGVFSKENEHRKDDILFLLSLGIGAVIGLVVFAKLLEILFANFPNQTMFCFVGMVAFSIPSLVKKEMSNDHFQIIPFVLGCALIFGIGYFAPEQTDTVITQFPALSLGYLALMFGLGIIAGGAMFVPGVSGSMILLIIGYYYLFKSLLANVTSFSLSVIIPLGFMAFGILAGIVLSSKITGYCLKLWHSGTMNFILGLVVASSVVLIPFASFTSVYMVITNIVGLVIGAIIMFLLEKLA